MFMIPSLRYKFDDERVTKEDVKRALEEQYGGEEEVIFLPVNFVLLCVLFVGVLMLALLYSFHRQTLATITLHSNLQNTQMHTCLCIYE